MKYESEFSHSSSSGEAWTLNISSFGGDGSFRLSAGGEVDVDGAEGLRFECIFESISSFSSFSSSKSFNSLTSASNERILSSKDSVLEEREVSIGVSRKAFHRKGQGQTAFEYQASPGN